MRPTNLQQLDCHCAIVVNVLSVIPPNFKQRADLQLQTPHRAQQSLLGCINFENEQIYFFIYPVHFAERSSQDILITSKLRTKRQSCQDGTYQHEGMACCLCAAGQHLESHCSVSPEDGTCVYCDEDRTYNSDPNSLDSCEPCTSCDPKANLEVEDRCTIFKDSVCRCQQGHYCNKGKEHCRACYPCTVLLSPHASKCPPLFLYPRIQRSWCQENNLSLNINKTKQLIVDFRKQQREHAPIHIDGTAVEKVESFKFLSVHPHRQCSEEGATAPIQPPEAEEICLDT
ncbi:uncharacterized protein LOC115113221 isoform X3 [Oncorhynchus nerka]|uniref:uncharacterized protein LOC115113221 isoform X3 n=1 Tax=Oncorhynchus nerka TaxID=8023 RepID=UPI0031B8439F